MRRFVSFDCMRDRLAATFDEADGTTGLLIVSGGNEIRAGGHAGQSRLAAWAAAKGHPAFRYDRPGIGDSEGDNRGFLHGGEALEAAVAAFRRECPQLARMVAFGNCDAATSLLFSPHLDIDERIIANPWLIEARAGDADQDNMALPSSAAIRARYVARLRNPVRLTRDLLGGSIDLGKFARGLARLRAPKPPAPLAARTAEALADTGIPTTILIASADATALDFQAAWKTPEFRRARMNPMVLLTGHATSSHSFSDDAAQAWLRERLLAALQSAKLDPHASAC